MGVDVVTWRFRIGRFVAKVKVKCCKPCGNFEFFPSMLKMFSFGVIIAALLVISGVEVNPGPTSLDDLYKKLEEMDKKITNISSVTNNLSVQLQVVVNELSVVKKENEELKKQLAINCELLDKLENQSRRNNLIFSNIGNRNAVEFWEESEQRVIEFVTKQLNVDLNSEHIERAHRLGRGPNAPIIVKFSAFKKKNEILKNAFRAKGTRVVISEDFSANVRETRKQLLNYMKDARARGDRARLQYNKLYINNRPFTLEELQKSEKTLVQSEQIVQNKTAEVVTLHAQKEVLSTTCEDTPTSSDKRQMTRTTRSTMVQPPRNKV